MKIITLYTHDKKYKYDVLEMSSDWFITRIYEKAVFLWFRWYNRIWEHTHRGDFNFDDLVSDVKDDIKYYLKHTPTGKEQI